MMVSIIALIYLGMTQLNLPQMLLLDIAILKDTIYIEVKMVGKPGEILVLIYMM